MALRMSLLVVLIFLCPFAFAQVDLCGAYSCTDCSRFGCVWCQDFCTSNGTTCLVAQCPDCGLIQPNVCLLGNSEIELDTPCDIVNVGAFMPSTECINHLQQVSSSCATEYWSYICTRECKLCSKGSCEVACGDFENVCKGVDFNLLAMACDIQCNAGPTCDRIEVNPNWNPYYNTGSTTQGGNPTATASSEPTMEDHLSSATTSTTLAGSTSPSEGSYSQEGEGTTPSGSPSTSSGSISSSTPGESTSSSTSQDEPANVSSDASDGSIVLPVVIGIIGGVVFLAIVAAIVAVVAWSRFRGRREEGYGRGSGSSVALTVQGPDSAAPSNPPPATTSIPASTRPPPSVGATYANMPTSTQGATYANFPTPPPSGAYANFPKGNPP